MKKWLLPVIMLFTVLTGCGKQAAEKIEIEVPKNELLMATMPKADNLSVKETQNLLTGKNDLSQEAIGKRPVAVMVNNIEPALPQYGISQADIIFELPVEGNQTRLMALYADYTKMPDICAIRSCRYYYPALAKGYDAFYVHWGSDQSILDYVNSLGIDRYDGIANEGGLFGRDAGRRSAGYALEHTGYFKGTQFASVVQKDGSRTELKDAKKETAFQFCDLGSMVQPTGQACNKAHIKFGAATATFTYSAEQGVYYKDINGHAHMDGRSNTQLSFTNVFILETSISTRDAAGHNEIDWKGSSSAKG